jgi:hypothetical protein
LAADYTHYELIVKELKLLEGCGVPLIYFLPTSKRYLEKSPSWIQRLLDEVTLGTLISFLASFENELHPLFYKLRESPDSSSTKLFPLANIGCIQKGEGLWPILGIDFLEKMVAHMHRHPFAGFIAMTPDVPLRTSLLDCSLWMAAGSLWERREPSLFLETWLRAFRPNWHTSFAEEAIRNGENILKRVSDLADYKKEFTQERFRFYVDGLAASLYVFKELALKVDKGLDHPLLFQTYAFAFLVDIKRLILSFVGSVSSPYFALQNESQDSFWTDSKEPFLLKKPTSFISNSPLAVIYESSIFH